MSNNPMEDIAQFDKKAVLRKILTKDAFERLSRVKLANPTVALQLESYLIQAYNKDQLRGMIDDNKLKQILVILTPEKKTRIKRR